MLWVVEAELVKRFLFQAQIITIRSEWIVIEAYLVDLKVRWVLEGYSFITFAGKEDLVFQRHIC